MGERIKAVGVIAGFMGELAFRYSAADMKDLWKAMDTMRKRYGDIFVADTIRKSETDAELALFRHIRNGVMA